LQTLSKNKKGFT